jgi:Ras family protein A
MLNSKGLAANVLAQWISEVMHFCPGLPIILVACKKDLRRDPRVIEELRRTNQRPVTPEEVCDVSSRSWGTVLTWGMQGMAVAQKIGAKQYLECSARTGEGVREVFQFATRAALLSKSKKKPSSKCVVL